jgi:hypothetical protein
MGGAAMSTHSYWQVGFNDGYARKPRRSRVEKWSAIDNGYTNGYTAGKAKRLRDDYHEPPEVAAARANHGKGWSQNYPLLIALWPLALLARWKRG